MKAYEQRLRRLEGLLASVERSHVFGYPGVFPGGSTAFNHDAVMLALQPEAQGITIRWLDEHGAVCGTTPAAPPPPEYARPPIDYRAGLLPPEGK